MKTEIEKFQSGFSGMPGVSQNHDGSTKRRLQPILLLDEALGSIVEYRGLCTPSRYLKSAVIPKKNAASRGGPKGADREAHEQRGMSDRQPLSLRGPRDLA